MILVGRVVRPVGLRGEVIVAPTGDGPQRFAVGAILHAKTVPPRELRVAASRDYGGRRAILFDGVVTIEDAEDLRGVWLMIPEGSLPALPDGVYYHYQIIGLMVVDSQGRELGRVVSILSTGSNDVYCAGVGREEVLIPAVQDYVERIDLQAGRLFLRVPWTSLGQDEDPV